MAENSCNSQDEIITTSFPDWSTENIAIATAKLNQLNGVSSGTTTHYATSSPNVTWAGLRVCPNESKTTSGGTGVGIGIKTTYWGPPATKTAQGCIYTTIACSTGTPTCKGGTPAIMFSSGTCPSYMKAENLVVNGTCYFSAGAAANGPGPCD